MKCQFIAKYDKSSAACRISETEQKMKIRTQKTYTLQFHKTDILPFLTAFFLILTFAIKAFTDGLYSRNQIGKIVVYSKYFTALLSCLFAILSSWGKKRSVFRREFINLMIIYTVFLIISVIMGIIAEKITVWIVLELVKPTIAVFLAYFVMNALDEDTVHRCLVIILYVCLAGYIVELFVVQASLASVFLYGFLQGKSATESNSFSEIAISLTFYFAYKRKGKANLIVSALFTILAFKRLAILFSIVTLVIAFIFPKITKANISRRFIFLLKILTIVVTLLWIWLLLPEQENLFKQIFGTTPFAFTSGRSSSLRLLLKSGFQSYGYGSANEYIRALYGVPFEMDLARIAIELTPFAMFLFIWMFWNLAGTKMWSAFIVGFFMLDFITSDSLSFNFAFTVTYMVIGVVNYAKIQNASIFRISKTRKRYRLSL